VAPRVSAQHFKGRARTQRVPILIGGGWGDLSGPPIVTAGPLRSPHRDYVPVVPDELDELELGQVACIEVKQVLVPVSQQ